MTLPYTIIHPAEHCFALNTKTGSVRITITEYNVLGRQLLIGQGDKSYSWKHLARDPDYRTVIVDTTNLALIQTSNPHAAHGSSKELYAWLGIMQWQNFPDQIKHELPSECDAVLHLYTREGHTNPISVIHVINPDFRQKPGATCVEVTKKLTQAYKNVFTIFHKTKTQHLRLQPIAGGCISGGFHTTHPTLTVAAMKAAYKLLPEETQNALVSTNIELCVSYEGDHRRYVSAFSTFIDKTYMEQTLAAQEQHRQQQQQQGSQRHQRPTQQQRQRLQR